MALTANAKFDFIKRNTSEILDEADLKKLLNEKKQPTVYLGTAITGSPHIAYFLWAIKMADFLKAGFKVKILLADIHGALDNTPWDILEKRYNYYKKVIPLLFEPLGVKSGIELVKGSDFQLKKEYILDLLKISTVASVHDCHKAASEVVKMGDNPKLSGLIYPLMQALDEEYLNVDVQYGGLDQRKIFVLAAESLPKVGYKKRTHVMIPMIPGLVGKKMSASDPKSKIDLLDDEQTVNKKIQEADCEAGNSDNGVMAFLKYVIFVLKKDEKKKLTIERPEKYGGSIEYETYESLEKDFINKNVHPLDVKNALAREINDLLKPIRKKREELLKLHKTAYS